MLNNSMWGLAVCAAIAASTILAKGYLWDLGSVYWLVLGFLAVAHIAVSGVLFYVIQGRPSIKLGIVVLLIVGQWWAIQMLAMQIIWRIRGFGS